MPEKTPDIIRIIESGSGLSHEMALACKDMVLEYNRYYLSPLLLAVKLNNVEAASALLEAGADLDVRDRLVNQDDRRYVADGYLAIHHAAMRFNLDMVKLLLKHGADIDSLSVRSHLTPLMLGMGSNSLPFVKFMVEQSKNLNYIATGGSNALDMAISSRVDDDILTFLLEAGAEINDPDTSSWSPLLRLVVNERYAMAELFIKYGANVHFRRISGDGIEELAKDKEWARRILKEG